MFISCCVSLLRCTMFTIYLLPYYFVYVMLYILLYKFVWNTMLNFYLYIIVWNTIIFVGAMITFYLNAFYLVVQVFWEAPFTPVFCSPSVSYIIMLFMYILLYKIVWNTMFTFYLYFLVCNTLIVLRAMITFYHNVLYLVVQV